MNKIEDIQNAINYFSGYEEGDNITITVDFLDNLGILLDTINALEKDNKFNREWNEYYKNEIGERNKLALKLINDKNIQGEKEILKELLKRGSKEIC